MLGMFGGCGTGFASGTDAHIHYVVRLSMPNVSTDEILVTLEKSDGYTSNRLSKKGKLR